jgi:hypothetical protein
MSAQYVATATLDGLEQACMAQAMRDDTAIRDNLPQSGWVTMPAPLRG